MRHAKSSWKSDAPNDHARPLNKRGRSAAQAMGGHLESIGWRPELILLSDSMRTTSTAELMSAAMQQAPNRSAMRALYHAGATEIVDAVSDVDDQIGTVLVLGHNPGWTSALTHLTGVVDELKTADAALLEGEGDTWRALFDAPKPFELITLVRSRSVDVASSTASAPVADP